MHLVAEGFRKLAMIARLIATGSLVDKGFLFWDEPESNLNPKIIKLIARTILHLCQNGIQVFVASHSLFLIRELDILLHSDEFKETEARFFGLHRRDEGIQVQQGDRGRRYRADRRLAGGAKPVGPVPRKRRSVMPSITEGQLKFSFPTAWQASKFDQWSFYRNQFQQVCGGAKAIDTAGRTSRTSAAGVSRSRIIVSTVVPRPPTWPARSRQRFATPSLLLWRRK